MSVFARYHTVWRRRGVLPMLQNLLQDFGVLSGLLSLSGGERAVTNFLHLAELLQAKAALLDGEQGSFDGWRNSFKSGPPDWRNRFFAWKAMKT